MAGISKDARKVNRAQKLYDDGLEKWLRDFKRINDSIDEINDLIHGYTMGKGADDERYQLSTTRFNALKDQKSFWTSCMKQPEKWMAHINDGLKKEVLSSKSSTPSSNSSSQPQLAVFSSQAKK